MADQLLSDMSDDDIFALLDKYNKDYENGVLDPQSETDLPTNDLINAVVGLRYLNEAGAFGEDGDYGKYDTLSKILPQELALRLGNLTNNDESDNIDGEEE
jgi:hypothetical protein